MRCPAWSHRELRKAYSQPSAWVVVWFLIYIAKFMASSQRNFGGPESMSMAWTSLMTPLQRSAMQRYTRVENRVPSGTDQSNGTDENDIQDAEMRPTSANLARSARDTETGIECRTYLAKQGDLMQHGHSKCNEFDSETCILSKRKEKNGTGG